MRCKLMSSFLLLVIILVIPFWWQLGYIEIIQQLCGSSYTVTSGVLVHTVV